MAKKNKRFREYKPNSPKLPWITPGLTPDYQRGFDSLKKGLDLNTKNMYPDKKNKPLEERLIYLLSDKQQEIKDLKDRITELENQLKDVI